ncbi:helix-turn-helix domain-containing protein [Paenibacillus sp. GCM10027627]|uniref:helix-turn-helix domain-containing protein n=1 Tax=unclassified Paenibacillus TaxID=185978 RepID=UPI003632F775
MQPWQYIVLIGAVVIVGAFVMPRKKEESAPASQSVRNMETALDQFMENMEKDNEQLLELVSSSQKAAKEEAEAKDKRILSLEQRCEQLEMLVQASAEALDSRMAQAQTVEESVKIVTNASSNGVELYSAEKIVSDSLKESAADYAEPVKERGLSLQDRYETLFQLYREGKSIEAIAKKLGMNKGEVQLIIGLSKQEESAHV